MHPDFPTSFKCRIL